MTRRRRKPETESTSEAEVTHDQPGWRIALQARHCKLGRHWIRKVLTASPLPSQEEGTWSGRQCVLKVLCPHPRALLRPYWNEKKAPRPLFGQLFIRWHGETRVASSHVARQLSGCQSHVAVASHLGQQQHETTKKEVERGQGRRKDVVAHMIPPPVSFAFFSLGWYG